MNKVILITGAASGIGAATVGRYLTETDFDVVALDVNLAGLSDLAEAFEHTDKLHCLAMDLTDEAQIKQALPSLITKLGALHHIVISHAVGIENQITDNDKWDTILGVNLMATQRLLAMLEPQLQEGGRVVVMSSVLGRAGKAANTGYVTSKHALLGLVKALAMDWASRKITVNAVLPCWVDTPMLRNELQPQADLMGLPVKQLVRQIKKRIPLRELISANDVADTVMFLTSPQARMVTAQGIVIDGGFTCGA